MKDQSAGTNCPVCGAALHRPVTDCTGCGTPQVWRLAAVVTTLDRSVAAVNDARADIQSYLQAVRTQRVHRPQPTATSPAPQTTFTLAPATAILADPATGTQPWVVPPVHLPRPAARSGPPAPPPPHPTPAPAHSPQWPTHAQPVAHQAAPPRFAAPATAARPLAPPPPAPPAPVAGGPEQHQPPRRPRRRLSPQATLLGLGVLLLLAAGVTFLAVNWDRLPVSVQAGIMATLALTALAGAVRASRRQLDGTAEALAILGYGFLAVDLYGARALDLIPASSIDPLPYAGLCCAVAGLANLVLPRLAPRVTTFGIVAVVVLQLPITLLMAGRVSLPVLLFALLVQVVCTVIWTATGTKAVRVTGTVCAAVVFAGILLVGCGRILLGLLATLSADPAQVLTEFARPSSWLTVFATAAVMGLAALTGVVLPRRIPLVIAVPRPAGECFCAAVAAMAAAATLPQLPLGGRWLGTALATAVVLAEIFRARRTGVVTAMLQTAALVVVGFNVMVCGVRGDLLQLSLLAAITAVLAVVAARRKRLSPASTVATTSFAAQAAVILAAADGVIAIWAAALALAVVAAVSIGVACVQVGRPAEVAALLAGGTAVVLADIVGLLTSEPLTATGLVLAIASAPLVAYGMQPGRRPALLVATALFTVANTTFVAGAGSTTLEWFTVPPAVVMVAIGLVGWREKSSWISVGPGLLLGLVSSALVADSNSGALRLALVVATAVVIVLLGVRFAQQAPFVIGANVLAKVAIWQFLEVAPLIPRWITLGLAGAIMLAVGASYERRLKEAKLAVRWVSALR